jgi:transcriptional regulator with XRE-family HTH domain
MDDTAATNRDWAIVGTKLQALRQQRGLSQEDLASLSQVRQQHISNMERRPGTAAGLATVMHLARALHVPLEDLVTAPPTAHVLGVDRGATPLAEELTGALTMAYRQLEQLDLLSAHLQEHVARLRQELGTLGQLIRPGPARLSRSPSRGAEGQPTDGT